MFTSAHKVAASSLNVLRRKVNLPQVLAGLQPILLLQMLGGLSQAVTSSVSHTQALARTLLMSGQQRLRDLLAAAPHLRLSLERALAPHRSRSSDLTTEEAAAQALLEMCLGLMLEWMARRSRRPHPNTPSSPRRWRQVLPSYLPSYPLLCLPRARPYMPVPLA